MRVLKKEGSTLGQAFLEESKIITQAKCRAINK